MDRTLLTWTRSAVLAAAILLLAPASWAQDEPAPEPPQAQTPSVDARFGGPRETMDTFLSSMVTRGKAETSRQLSRATSDAIACLSLPPGTSAVGGEIKANQLYQVLNKLGTIQTYRMPDGEGASERELISYTIFPNVDLVRSGPFGDQRSDRAYRRVEDEAPDGAKIELVRQADGEWKFSPETLEGIQTFLGAVEDLPDQVGGFVRLTPAERLRAMMPASLKRHEVLGLEPYQWLGMLLILFVGVLVDQVLRAILRGIYGQIVRRREVDPDKAMIARAVRPFGLFAAALIWYFALPLLALPPTALLVMLAAVRVFLMFSAVWAAYRLVDVLADFLRSKAALTTTRYDDLLVPLVRKTLKLFVTAGGVIYIADAFEFEILPLLTGLGIGGLAVAFAARDTIENFFGSVAVILDRPFEVGDWVEIEGKDGTVETVGIRSTRIRTFYNSLVTVPNSTLVRARVDNYGKRRYRRFKTTLNVTYDTAPEKIEAFCAGIRELISLHPYTRKDYYHVWLNAFGPHSLDILVYMFHECPDWSTELRERHRFMLDIIRLADQLGVEFAFPTQTLHVFKEEHDQTHEPKDRPKGDAERSGVLLGRRAARALTREQPWLREQPGPVTFAHEPVPPVEEEEPAGGEPEFRGTEARET